MLDVVVRGEQSDRGLAVALVGRWVGQRRECGGRRRVAAGAIEDRRSHRLRRAARTHKLLRPAAAARGGKIDRGSPARCDAVRYGAVRAGEVRCSQSVARETERREKPAGRSRCRRRCGRQDATVLLQKLRSRQEGRRSTVDCGLSPVAAQLSTSRLVGIGRWATFLTFSMLDLSKSGVGTECARRLARTPNRANEINF